MKKTILYSIFALICWLPITGCSKYTVAPGYQNTSDVIYKKTVAKSYFWGIINKPHTIKDTTCGKAGLSEVKITSNLGYSVIHVATLGIVHLVKIEYKCQKEPPVIGE
jgi:hypothetical protein